MTEESDVVVLVREAGRWRNYESALRTQNRYILADDGYFTQLFQTCLACARPLDAGTELYRARINPPEREGDPLPIAEMGQPLVDIPDGRVNPAGIPCFYAAFEPGTAIAEKRPWVLAQVSVAKFTTVRSHNILDLRLRNNIVGKSPSLTWVSHMIGRPTHRDDRFGYLGTQYLAERLKASNVDGLLYDSALYPLGTNIALFGDASGLRGDAKVAIYGVFGVTYDAKMRPE